MQATNAPLEAQQPVYANEVPATTGGAASAIPASMNAKDAKSLKKVRQICRSVPTSS